VWYRVEVRKDGSIVSCAEVEGSFAEAKHVYYVEADSREQACSAAALRFVAKERARKIKHYEKKKALGLCSNCGKQSRQGKAFCVDCSVKQSERDRRRHKEKAAGVYVKPAVLSVEERYQRNLERDRKHHFSYVTRVGDWHDDLHLPTLRLVLERFHTMSQLREWLDRAREAPAEAAE
jgi:hypothetical protein